MTITKKGRKVLSVHATHHRRDESGKFVKETVNDTLIRKRDVIKELSKDKEEFEEFIEEEQTELAELEEELKVERYVYHVSADYKPENRGRIAGHSFHMEFQVISPEKLSDTEVAEFIRREVEMRDDKLFAVIDVCDFTVAEPDIFEVDYEPEKEVKYTLKSIRYKV